MTERFDCERLRCPPVLLFRLQPLKCDQIDIWASALIRRLGCRLIDREQGADRLGWIVDIAGRHLLLQYEHYGECAWLEPLRAADEALLDRVYQQLRKNSCARE